MSAGTPRPPKVPRSSRPLLGLIVALAVVALAALGATAAIQIRAGHRRTALGDTGTVAHWLAARTWHDSAVLAIGIALAALGVLLVLAAVTPSRRRLVELHEVHPGTTTGITRAGLRRELAAIAARVDGIDAATARVGRRRVKVRATSSLRNRTGLDEAVQQAVTTELTRLEPRRPRRVRTRVRGKDS